MYQIVGLGIINPKASFAIRFPLCWDPKRGEHGYFQSESIRSVIHPLPEEFINENVKEISNRTKNNWYWLKVSINLFPNAAGFYLQNDLANLLTDLTRNKVTKDSFLELVTQNELYHRVRLGFAPLKRIIKKTEQWYDLLEPLGDEKLKETLNSGNNQADAIKMCQDLQYLSTTAEQDNQARLRFMLAQYPGQVPDQLLSQHCKFMRAIYRSSSKDETSISVNTVQRDLDSLRNKLLNYSGKF